MVIEDACDPQRQARELVSTNWVAEYYTEFESPTEDGQAADGTFDISSSADLFVNEAGGAAGFKAMVGDELRAANSQCQSANMGSVTPFDFPTIGDESWGATATATFSGVSGLVSAVFTSVVARSGQVVVTVSIVQIGGQGLPDETERLAQLMIQRISGSPNV